MSTTATKPAGVAVEDVPWWVLDWEKVAHPVVRTDGAFCFTYCAMMTGTPVRKPGKRGICRKCRAALKTASLAPATAATA